MSKEDFKNGAKPIDMSDFPYCAGDKLPGGITVVSVIKGDANDSFGGYLVKPVLDVVGTKRKYGEPYVFKPEGHPFSDRDGRNPMLDSSNFPDGVIAIENMGIVGDPYCQRVVYRLDGNPVSKGCTPAEFLELVKGSEPVAKAEPQIEQEWTPGDIEFIKENYKTMTDAEMAKFLEKEPDLLKRYRLDVLKFKKNG